MGVAPGSGGLDGWVDWARLVLELLMNDEYELLIERSRERRGGRRQDYGQTKRKWSGGQAARR